MASQPQQDFEEQDDDIEVVQTPGNDDDGGDVEPSEEQARRLGWKPKDEFKGDESQWRDWQDFLNEDLSNAPQLKATVKLLKRRLDQADRRAKKMEQTLDEAKEYFTKAEERAYNRAVTDIRKKQREAVAVGDTDAFDDAEAELEELNKDVKQKTPAKPAVDPEVAKTFRKWERENDWYNTDKAMTVVANDIAAAMGSYSDNGMEPDEYLEELTARVKKEFPHKFAAPAKKRSAVEGVAETRSTKGQETFDNLPSEWKQQFKRFEDMGIPVKKESFTKDAWGEINKDKRK